MNSNMMCRTCLTVSTDVKYQELKTPFEENGLTLLEVLLSCTQLENVSEFPAHLCTKCCDTLRISYKFIKKAIEAHNTLISRFDQKECAMQSKESKVQCAIRFRCKICDCTVESKKSLKAHVEIHSNKISFNCQMCSFECNKRSQLNMHYLSTHKQYTTRGQLGQIVGAEQLKPIKWKTTCTLNTDELNMQIIHNATEKTIRNYSNQRSPTVTKTICKVYDSNEPKKSSTIVKFVKCKICSEQCISYEKLKFHMLIHKEIPHFICEQCSFFTFFKIDLLQHYKMQHKLYPRHCKLQSKNKMRIIGGGSIRGCRKKTINYDIFSCDLCLFETSTKYALRQHYLNDHQVHATDVQLRPTVGELCNLFNNKEIPLTIKTNAGEEAQSILKIPIRNKETNRCSLKSDFPAGYKCHLCDCFFYSSTNLSEHYKEQHNFSDVPLFAQKVIEPEKTNNIQKSVTEQINVTENIETLLPFKAEELLTTKIVTAISAINTNTSTHLVPLDAIPQIVEMDTIENDFDYDYNEDVFFEDFNETTDATDDDDVVVNVQQQQDFLLTSDENTEYGEDGDYQTAFGVNNSPVASLTYCAQCSRQFPNHYQFENHMFVHRGLAPFRCEMCTNLYNAKHALIRHYRSVHKLLPTRDMLQPKSDKNSLVVQTSKTQSSNLQSLQVTTFLCAKCPFVSQDLPSLQLHLKINHGTNDDNYVLQKLPYECSRCIRSFATKSHLQRHLLRSHTSAIIIKHVSTGKTIASVAEESCATTNKTDSLQPTIVATTTASTVTMKNARNSNLQTKRLKMLLEDDAI